MIVFPDYELIEQIGETLHSVVYRARKHGRSETVILKALKTAAPSATDIARLKHEYELISRIAIDGIIRVHDIIDHDGVLALIMEDFGGVSLKEFIREGFTTERFLDLAIRLSRILGELHREGITHRDIKPGNILYNRKDNILKITDFGIAAEITRKNEEVYNPEVIKGTLAYMSPEQTGRINCPVDYRSDLYSLGITFYEMLTGGVPFMAKDPMEIIYAHIAKTAVPPLAVNPNVPETISAIVMRLLAKALEERYQNSFGLMADLEACQSQMQRHGKIAPFALGARDISFQFSIPSVLVGRDAELGLLNASFEKAREGAVEFKLVAGEPGVGKSALIYEMNKPIVGSRGYFLSGKYDQLRRHVPYSAIIQAFQSLARQLLSESEERLQAWRARLAEALGANGKIITDAIPEMALIIGEQPDLPELGPEESQNRFNLVCNNFVRVFANGAHPLVIFLDDLQWADAASLNFIQTLIVDKGLSHLLLIGAYRDNETAAHHPLMLCLDEIRKKGVVPDILKLAVLDIDSVHRLMANFLRRGPEAVLPLARIVHAKTLGNPFFVNQFLKTLYEEKYLSLDVLSGWCWDVNAIGQMQVTDNVVELMTAKIAHLPPAPLAIIKGCACIGNRFGIETLAALLGLPLGETLSAMDALIHAGLINYADKHYRFHHDRIQEAAYSLVSNAYREELHYKIGHRLLRATAPAELPAKIFFIVDQFNQATPRLQPGAEKRLIAELNLKAGIKANEATAYAAAANYFQKGIALLPDDAWTTEYELTYALHKECMACEYLNRDFEESERLFARITRNASNRIDRAKAYRAMVVLYTNIGKLDAAIDLGIEGVKMFGVRLPKDCGKLPVLLEIVRFKRKIAKIGIENIIDLPVCSDREILSLCELYGAIGLPAYCTNPNLFALTIFKGINGDLKNGLVHTSAFGFIAVAAVIVSELGDQRTANRLGEMALKLNAKMDDKRHAAKVHFVFGFLIRHWSRPLRESLEYIRKGYKLGLETGDFVYCGHCLNEMSMIPLLCGDNIDEVMAEHAKYRQFQENVKDPFVANQYRLLTQFCLNLKGATQGPFSLDTADFDHAERVAAMRAQGNPLNVFFLLLMKEKVDYLYGNYKQAYQIGFEIDPLLEYPKGSYSLVEHIYYRCLSLLAAYPGRTPSEKRKIMKRVHGFKKRLKAWGTSCPANYLHKYLLIAAEECAARNRHLEAADLYRQAIQSAREHGFTNNEALANERAALFYQGKGYQEIAEVYFKEAYRCYEKWGATGKMREMAKTHAFITLRSATARSATDTFTSLTAAGSSGTSTLLDLGTVMKVSQAISSEIVLDRLLGSIMQIAVTNAGARKAFFILDTEGSLSIEALQKEGTDEEIQVRRATPLASRDDLSLAIVHYVHRSGEAVILGNATQEGIFKNDPYVLREKCKSVLAMPIVNKGKTSGILYMENNLITHAFSSDRLELLRIISAQAAISIENALLFEQATTDGLTKLYVHRYFQFLLDQEISRSRRHNKSFSLIMMDIDNFKSLNDAHGHQVGDEVLRNVAKTIKQNLRAEDCVARYGGEEFVVILPETESKGALVVAEKVRHFVQELRVPNDNEPLSVTISLGVATFPHHATAKQALIKSADEALYASKHAGKNRVSVGGKID